jgi:hypothetical protein
MNIFSPQSHGGHRDLSFFPCPTMDMERGILRDLCVSCGEIHYFRLSKKNPETLSGK